MAEGGDWSRRHGDNQERLRDDSDELLEALTAMKAAEADKRDEPISSPRFHELADEVEARARDIWSNARRERVDGEQTTTTGASIDQPAGSPRDETGADAPPPDAGHQPGDLGGG